MPCSHCHAAGVVGGGVLDAFFFYDGAASGTVRKAGAKRRGEIEAHKG